MGDHFIPTRASIAKGRKADTLEVVSFHSHKPKLKTSNAAPSFISEQKEDSGSVFNIKQAKHEIIRFGMSGFDPQKKQEARIQLAVKLGAKPPKNKYKNYKELMKERQQEKAKEKSRIDFQQLGKNSIGKSNAKGKSFDRKRRKANSGIIDIYGKVEKPTKKTTRK